MIDWRPIETQPRDATHRLHTDGRAVWALCQPLTGCATHWAPINMPGEIKCHRCEPCGSIGVCRMIKPDDGNECKYWIRR